MKQRRIHIRAVIILIAFTLLLCACQPTPDAPIVNAGDDTVLNDKINATLIPTPEPPENSDEPIETLSTIYGFPAEYNDEFQCTDTDVKLIIDAAVSVTEVQSVPVAEVEPFNLPSEFVKNFVEKMHPGLTFYEDKEVRSRENIIYYFELYEREAAMPWEEFLEYFRKETGNDKEEIAWKYYQQCQAMVPAYRELVKNLPETYEPEPADFMYHESWGFYNELLPEDEYGFTISGDTVDTLNRGYKYIRLYATTDDSMSIKIFTKARFTKDFDCAFSYYLGNTSQGYEGTLGDWGNYRPVWDALHADPKPLSEAEALGIANDTIEKMGLADVMALAGISSSSNGRKHTLYFYRGFSGLVGRDVNIENEYAHVVGNESVKIIINDGFVTEIQYENLYEVTKTENSNVGLVSFEQAYDAFKKQARLEYTKAYLNDSFDNIDDEVVLIDDFVTHCDVTITDINFVMVRIPIRNGGYRYVPAWQFVGTRDIYKRYTEHKYKYTYKGTFMTINAVDGTRIAGIDRNLSRN